MADVELLCANCQLEDLVEITEALGGEASSKDASLVNVDGFAIVLAKVARMKEINEQVHPFK